MRNDSTQEMSKPAIRIDLATRCGWTMIESHLVGDEKRVVWYGFHKSKHSLDRYRYPTPLPEYCTDAHAIHNELVSLSPNDLEDYSKALAYVVQRDAGLVCEVEIPQLLTATPRQCSEACLRALMGLHSKDTENI